MTSATRAAESDPAAVRITMPKKNAMTGIPASIASSRAPALADTPPEVHCRIRSGSLGLGILAGQRSNVPNEPRAFMNQRASAPCGC